MDATLLANCLLLLKQDLGITHDLRDAYFSNVIKGSLKEIETLGLVLILDNVDDQMLLVDYATWHYRFRNDNVPLSRSIQFRIHNRVIKKAGTANAIN